MKKRLDQFLVDSGLAESVVRAQALIMARLVFKGTQRLHKPAIMMVEGDTIEVKGKPHPYVSRGGLKLAAALDTFNIIPKNFIALDVGASTGGFTDVLLRSGVQKVYAVDVGTNQLAWSLREDPRVVVMEQTNARHLTAQLIPDAIDIVVCDASFISLKNILPAALALAKKEAWLVALIKPQFEVPREAVGKGGIVRDENLHASVCDDISIWLENAMHWQKTGVIESPILGAEGNKEFLLVARKG